VHDLRDVRAVLVGADRGRRSRGAAYVVSGTLTTAIWKNSKIIGLYDPDMIRSLNDEVGDLYVTGSGALVQAMLADGLVDELHLFVDPLTRGSGPRLFPRKPRPGTCRLRPAGPRRTV
jgi:dihydrofolate reductase